MAHWIATARPSSLLMVPYPTRCSPRISTALCLAIDTYRRGGTRKGHPLRCDGTSALVRYSYPTG